MVEELWTALADYLDRMHARQDVAFNDATVQFAITAEVQCLSLWDAMTHRLYGTGVHCCYVHSERQSNWQVWTSLVLLSVHRAEKHLLIELDYDRYASSGQYKYASSSCMWNPIEHAYLSFLVLDRHAVLESHSCLCSWSASYA